MTYCDVCSVEVRNAWKHERTKGHINRKSNENKDEEEVLQCMKTMAQELVDKESLHQKAMKLMVWGVSSRRTIEDRKEAMNTMIDVLNMIENY